MAINTKEIGKTTVHTEKVQRFLLMVKNTKEIG